MNLIHLINSTDFFLFKEKTNDLLKKIKKENNLVKITKTFLFDLEEKKIQSLINELNTKDFFFIKKIIIKINNWGKLTKKQQLLIIDNLKFTKNPIFLWNNVSKKTKIDKKLEEIATIYWIPKITRIKKIKFIKEKLDENKIFYEKEIIEWINSNTLDNFLALNNEMNKIIFYYFSIKKLIKLSDVKEILTKIKKDNFFTFFNEFLKNNKKNTLKIYNNISEEKTSDIHLFFTLETYIWLMKKTEFLSKKKMNYNEIAKVMKKNPYFIFNLKKIIENQNSSIINFSIKKWYKFEYNIKIGSLPLNILFKYFLIS